MKLMINGEEKQLGVDTVATLLAYYKIEAKNVVVEINKSIVPREQFTQRKVHAGDVIEIVKMVGGG